MSALSRYGTYLRVQQHDDNDEEGHVLHGVGSQSGVDGYGL